ncbi:Aromatic hydroxylase fmpF [Colletotrichum orbiculare MAFF 240422]|uniref:Aromatic hydroxylase fmpF n=1 Tax=Colletotrichum orbiculare (strain 104-T / ATCC 96160 / CBS 514.97 / LARS 414 / MAFF 240422) TaxID=1213857 RepID=N4V524_COLOR|nr:Aromatic hydroxylase fmpF [Colletotrichum orbiculare MAFF 240422]
MPHANGKANGYDQTDSAAPERVKSDVCIVGAGPAGLMLGSLLARFGQKVDVIDERRDQTTVGRADGIQPKSIETLQMLRVGDELFRTGVKVHDICMWQSSGEAGLRRISRSIHYPAAVVDLLQPYILLCHQGMIEAVFIDDLRRSGVEVQRNRSFQTYEALDDGSLRIECGVGPEEEQQQQQQQQKQSPKTTKTTTIHAEYLVGCDGARSLVRKSIPDTYAQGTPHTSVWGVLDGELDTDFPDIWSKTVVFSERHGSVLIIPRERNMTRLYIEMKEASTSSAALGEAYVMEQARLILAPYRVGWRSVEWFGNYRVAQRVAARFSDERRRAFIAGDASHTHSPKAAQGMNTSIHDSWNLGWKLNLALRGFGKAGDGAAGGVVLLASYEGERKKIAHDLIDFDYEHANEIARGDAERLADNFSKNTRFISGVGVEYGENELNRGPGPSSSPRATTTTTTTQGAARPGCNLPPAKATRYLDACPVDVQLDVPVLGQFRIYAVLDDVAGASSATFLRDFNDSVAAETSLFTKLSRAAALSYQEKPRAKRADDVHVRPERYTSVSELGTFALITSTDKNDFEVSSLPPVFSRSGWTVYLDDVAPLDTQGRSCTEKWLGGLAADEAAIVIVRPDGYVGTIGRWDTAQTGAGSSAAQWLDEYFGGFLQVPPSS